MAGSLYQRFNTVSQGLNGMPSLSRTQGENADFDLARHDMNGVGSPLVMPSNVLSDPKMDAFFDSVNDAAGEKPVKFGYAGQPDHDALSNDPDWYAQNQAALPRDLPPSIAALMHSNQLGTPMLKGRR